MYLMYIYALTEYRASMLKRTLDPTIDGCEPLCVF